MKNETPHITVGQIASDPFLPTERSKSFEHTDRLRSDFYAEPDFKNNQKLMKIEEK